MPRPTKLNPDIAERIVQAMSVGATYEIAARVGGVNERTLRRWIALGERQKSGEYALFAKSVREVQSKLVTRLLAVIDKAAAMGDWKAAAWKLAHVLPEQYSDKRVELTGKNGAPIQHEVRGEDVKPVDPVQHAAEILKVLNECGVLDEVIGADAAGTLDAGKREAGDGRAGTSAGRN